MAKSVLVFGIFILATVSQSGAIWDVAKIDSLHFGEPYSPFALDRLGVVTEEFITQRLDNFDPQNNRSFEMVSFSNTVHLGYFVNENVSISCRDIFKINSMPQRAVQFCCIWAANGR